MALQIGIVGLPNVGKSTLFNALTRTRGAQAANYPFCTIDPNVGIVEVPDTRLNALKDLVQPEKTIPAAVDFVDIAGIVKGAHAGEGLGNQFLSHIREADAICHVVRAFGGGEIIHVDGTIDAARDRETIEAELILADMASLEKRKDKAAGAARSGDKDKKMEVALIERLIPHLDSGKMASSLEMSEEEAPVLKHMQLLTAKPMIYAVNLAEHELAGADESKLKEELKLPPEAIVLPVSAKIEEDLQDLSHEEASQYLQDLGVSSSGLDRLIRAAYAVLGLQTYFTAGPKEVRAWTIPVGSTAPQAAGAIHTDFERGFICAEITAYDDYIACNGEKGAKEKGKLRTEGKTYIMKDGDVVHFRFNV